MARSPYEIIDQFSNRPGVSLGKAGEAKVLAIKRDGLIIEVTVPEDVLEWFASVMDGATSIVEDWQDYEGYDDTSREHLAFRMASDIEEFVGNILNRDIRLAVVSEPTFLGILALGMFKRNFGFSTEKRVLEWMNKGSWEPALPFP